jgi:hypothetical protein
MLFQIRAIPRNQKGVFYPLFRSKFENQLSKHLRWDFCKSIIWGDPRTNLSPNGHAVFKSWLFLATKKVGFICRFWGKKFKLNFWRKFDRMFLQDVMKRFVFIKQPKYFFLAA